MRVWSPPRLIGGPQRTFSHTAAPMQPQVAGTCKPSAANANIESASRLPCSSPIIGPNATTLRAGADGDAAAIAACGIARSLQQAPAAPTGAQARHGRIFTLRRWEGIGDRALARGTRARHGRLVQPFGIAVQSGWQCPDFPGQRRGHEDQAPNSLSHHSSPSALRSSDCAVR